VQITASAFLATQLDDEYGQRPVQARVVQVRIHANRNCSDFTPALFY